MKPKKPTKKAELEAIAARISKCLKAIERDPNKNPVDPKYRTRSYYYTSAIVSGRGVKVTYVSYQGQTRKLTREEAETYAAWLEAGNVGEHYTALGIGGLSRLHAKAAK